jgi:hypothetical protein
MKRIAWTALFLLLISTAHSQQKPAPVQPSYSHDSKGLEKQLEPALQAYTAGKLPDVDKQFHFFLLPDAQEWLAQYFPQDRVQELGKRQAEAEDDWETGLTALMSLFPKGTQFHVHCTPSQTKSPRETQTSDGIVLPSSPPPIETYLLEFSANKTNALGIQSFASVALLVYTNGAYRFVGDENGAFWSAPSKHGNNGP